LHQRYTAFTPQLLTQLQRALAVPAKSDKEDERAAWLARQRPLLRLLAELYVVRVITDPAPVFQAVKDVVRTGNRRGTGSRLRSGKRNVNMLFKRACIYRSCNMKRT